jgi:hypothetical protein
MQCNLPILKRRLDWPPCNILKNKLSSPPLCVLGVDKLAVLVNFDDVRVYR